MLVVQNVFLSHEQKRFLTFLPVLPFRQAGRQAGRRDLSSRQSGRVRNEESLCFQLLQWGEYYRFSYYDELIIVFSQLNKLECTFYYL